MTERNLDFDRIINRKNTDCLKYDFAVKRGMPADVLPLWVADMDLRHPPTSRMRWWSVQKWAFTATAMRRLRILRPLRDG